MSRQKLLRRESHKSLEESPYIPSVFAYSYAGWGGRRLACVTPEAEEELWDTEEQYSTAASTLINSSTPRDGPKHSSPG